MMEVTEHCNLLRQNRVSLVQHLNPDLILPKLVPILGEHVVCSISKDPNTESKTRRILDNLERLPLSRFDKFCTVIAGVHPTLFETLKGRAPSREERDFFIEPFRKNLCEEILKKGNVISNRIDWKINLDTQYTTLLLEESNKGSVRTERNNDYSTQVSMEDIPLNSLAGKLVLFRGRAGVGKSILAQHMMRKYSKDEGPSPFTLIFLLNLRKLVLVSEKMTLSELLGMYAEYQIDKPDPVQPSAEWLEENAQNILVFTDGVDELPELSSLFERMKKLTNPKMKGTPIDWCLNLMKRNVLHSSSIVLVSRPFIALSCLRYDLEVEVIGLTPEKIQEFIAKNVQEEAQNVVRETLEKNQVLKSVCTITFYCAAICKILEMDLSIDDSMLTTYTRITAYIITRLAARKAAHEPLTSVIAQELSDCLPDMASLASRGMFENSEVTRLVFCRNDLSQVQFRNENVAKATQTGLLFFTEAEDLQAPIADPTIEAEFLHLSIQEFLAMAKLPHSDEASMREALRRFSSSGRFNMSQLFLCGLTLDQRNEHVAGIKHGVSTVSTEPSSTPAFRILSDLMKDLCKKIKETNAESLLLQVIQMAYESQTKSLANLVGNAIAPNGKLLLSGLQITAVDMKALVFILENNSVEHLSLDNIPIDCASAHELSTFLKNSNSLKTLMLTNNNLTKEGIGYLSEGIAGSTTLAVLKLVYQQITDEAMGMLTTAAVANNTLKSLQFWDTPITDVGFEHVSKGVKFSRNLTHLQLRNLKLSDISGKSLAEGIKTSRCLKSLQLTYIDLSAEIMRHLGAAVKSSTSLNHVRIEYTTITDDSMRILCDGMKQSKTLKHLQLSNTPVTDEGMRHLCDAVMSLECLDLMFNGLTSHGWSLLFNTVKITKSLTHLVLRYTKMTQAEVTSFSAAMEATTSLKQLTLFNNQFSADGLKLVFAGLKAAGSIEVLELFNLHLSDGTMAELGEVLAGNKVLKELTVVGDPISDEAMAHLCQGIRSSESLRTLKLGEHDVSAAGKVQLNDTLQSCPCEFQPFVMAEHEHIPTVARFMKLNKKPMYINLTKANFTDSTHSHYMAALVYNEVLEVFHIKMESSTMTDECAPALADMFTRNQTLRHFSMQCSRWSDATFRSLLLSLTDNTTLQVLQLDRATMTRQDALSLTGFLFKNRTMTHLRLGENQVSGELLSKLLDILSENLTLQRIELAECLMPAGFADHFVRFLSEKEGLKSIRALTGREENVCLEVTEVGSTSPICYPVSRVGCRIEYTVVAEVLQQQLSSWAERHKLLTMVDPVDGKLMVLVPEGDVEQLTQQLHEQLTQLGPGDTLLGACKVVPQGLVSVEQLKVSVEPSTEQHKVVNRGPVSVEQLKMSVESSTEKHKVVPWEPVSVEQLKGCTEPSTEQLMVVTKYVESSTEKHKEVPWEQVSAEQLKGSVGPSTPETDVCRAMPCLL